MRAHKGGESNFRSNPYLEISSGKGEGKDHYPSVPPEDPTNASERPTHLLFLYHLLPMRCAMIPKNYMASHSTRKWKPAIAALHHPLLTQLLQVLQKYAPVEASSKASQEMVALKTQLAKRNNNSGQKVWKFLLPNLLWQRPQMSHLLALLVHRPQRMLVVYHFRRRSHKTNHRREPWIAWRISSKTF